MTPNELGNELRRMYEDPDSGGQTTAVHLFGIRHADDIRESVATVSQIVRLSGIPESYATEVHKGIALASNVIERVAPGPERRCDTCRWWGGRTEAGSSDSCRRHAPRLLRGDDPMTRRFWPVTLASDWCGEWDDGRPYRRFSKLG